MFLNLNLLPPLSTSPLFVFVLSASFVFVLSGSPPPLKASINFFPPKRLAPPIAAALRIPPIFFNRSLIILPDFFESSFPPAPAAAPNSPAPFLLSLLSSRLSRLPLLCLLNSSLYVLWSAFTSSRVSS